MGCCVSSRSSLKAELLDTNGQPTQPSSANANANRSPNPPEPKFSNEATFGAGCTNHILSVISNKCAVFQDATGARKSISSAALLDTQLIRANPR